MSLFVDVVSQLHRSGVAHCLIGGSAVAVHGVARSTLDDDILVVDRAVLEPASWGKAMLPPPGADYLQAGSLNRPSCQHSHPA